MARLDDQRDDAEFLRDVLKGMSPNWILKWIAAKLTERAGKPPERRMWTTIALSMTRGIGATPEDLAAMNAQADARHGLLDASPAFREALARIEAVGVVPEWGGGGEYGYTSRELRLFVPLQAVPRLQEMTAEDAGIASEDRAEAAALFERWLLQRYHPDWEEYKKRWPVVERCPYDTAANAFGHDPSPIKA